MPAKLPLKSIIATDWSRPPILIQHSAHSAFVPYKQEKREQDCSGWDLGLTESGKMGAGVLSGMSQLHLNPGLSADVRSSLNGGGRSLSAPQMAPGCGGNGADTTGK